MTRDRDQAPYLAWINHKMHERAAFFPISTELAALIAAQQHRQRARFPAGTRYLFTRYQANLGGQRPMHHTTCATSSTSGSTRSTWSTNTATA